MKDVHFGYSTVIAENLLIPIVKLIEALKLSGIRSVNEVQTSCFENGYATAIILLTVCLLESILNRTKHTMGITSKGKVWEFFENTFSESGLNGKLKELFVVRDVIAHNHIWEATIKYDQNYNLKLVSADLLEGYGDSKFRGTIGSKERKTKQLGINLFPTRICWSDVVTVLKEALKIMLFLEGKDRRYVYISEEHVEFNTEIIKFLDLVNDLK